MQNYEGYYNPNTHYSDYDTRTRAEDDTPGYVGGSCVNGECTDMECLYIPCGDGVVSGVCGPDANLITCECDPLSAFRRGCVLMWVCIIIFLLLFGILEFAGSLNSTPKNGTDLLLNNVLM
ncbi:uncharacterized protein NEMAJ01_0413 [Nematocida major]|uniref:uncharacterized protein n=1 Tax=Nematocida major TaxID=1912982 RepID=UPI002008D14E|nr:uncharacterized protein NEMAJ01_0413 [Nematocida major]KAH9385517.1 hypothetical protein NEMAJ01_0413 [Nematocida major]